VVRFVGDYLWELLQQRTLAAGEQSQRGEKHTALEGGVAGFA
jgi:hypothetical protein